jgi:hypothetical protein
VHLAVGRVAVEQRGELVQRGEVLGLFRIDDVELAVGGGGILEDKGIARRDAGLVERLARFVERLEAGGAEGFGAAQAGFDAVDAHDRKRSERHGHEQDERERAEQARREAVLGKLHIFSSKILGPATRTRQALPKSHWILNDQFLSCNQKSFFCRFHHHFSSNAMNHQIDSSNRLYFNKL